MSDDERIEALKAAPLSPTTFGSLRRAFEIADKAVRLNQEWADRVRKNWAKGG